MPVTTPYELVSVKKLVMVLLYGGMVVEVDSSAATAAAGYTSTISSDQNTVRPTGTGKERGRVQWSLVRMQQPRMAPESGWSNACCSSGAVRVMWAYDMVDRYSMYVVGGNEGEKRANTSKYGTGNECGCPGSDVTR